MEEPFWLGLLAVIFVLGILGAAYTVKKHLPEKFDGLLADGAEGGTKTRTGPEKRGNAPSMTGMFSSLMIFKYIWYKKQIVNLLHVLEQEAISFAMVYTESPFF